MTMWSNKAVGFCAPQAVHKNYSWKKSPARKGLSSRISLYCFPAFHSLCRIPPPSLALSKKGIRGGMAILGEEGEVQPLGLFLSIGLDRRTAENALVNPKVTANLTAVIKEVRDLFPAFFLFSSSFLGFKWSLPQDSTHRRWVLEEVTTLPSISSLFLCSEWSFLEAS